MSLTVGSDILGYCTSCRMDLNHRIVSKNGEKPGQAECRTCKKIHQFRAPKGAKAPIAKAEGATAAEKKLSKKVVAMEVEWERLVTGAKKAPKEYTIRTAFALGEVVIHPNFGNGIVQKIIHPNKVEVLFRHDVKVLIHGGV